MSLLPSFITESATAVTNAEIPKEYGIDFETGQLTGEIVTGKEAIKVWIWNCLRTERYRYGIYSWNYGVSLDQYIGRTLSEDFLQTDAQEEIREALTVNPWITGISDFTAAKTGTKLTLSFTVNTSFGDIEVNFNV